MAILGFMQPGNCIIPAFCHCVLVLCHAQVLQTFGAADPLVQPSFVASDLGKYHVQKDRNLRRNLGWERA